MCNLLIIMHSPDPSYALHLILSVLQASAKSFLLSFLPHNKVQQM